MNTIDVIKAAYRQTKDGFAITFVLHPQDDHEELARAPIGSQWQIRAVPLDDDGNPKEEGHIIAGPDECETGIALTQAINEVLAEDPGHALAPGREAGETSAAAPASASRLIRQAAIACKDTLFWVFLTESGTPVRSVNEAAVAVRRICHVASRKEFGGGEAGTRWESLWRQYQAWKLAPEVA